MATTNVRWTVVKHLIDTLRADPRLAGVRVEPGYPGDEAGAECVWVYGLDGDVEIPVMTGGRKQRDDKFDIPLIIRVMNNADLDPTFQRLTEIVGAIEDTLADDSSMAGVDGVLSAEIGHIGMSCGPTKQLYAGVAEVTVSVHSRLY